MKKRIADLIFETLVRYNINICFAVAGGGAMHLDNALGLNKDIEKIFNHHEQACTIAAEGYAKITGQMAIACVTSGPGATNALTGVMGAWVDSVPMIVLSGQVRYSLTAEATGLPLRFRGPQEFDIINSVKNMTKYAVMLREPGKAVYELEKAIHIAMTGRRGPVWLDIPLDIQGAEVEEKELQHFKPEETLVSCSEKEFFKLEEMIKKAERPVILAGNGIANSGALEKFHKFAKYLGIPVVGAAIAVDVMYSDYELYYGLSGVIGPRTGNFILQNSDLILALGTSLGFKTTGYSQELFAPKAKIVMIDIDEYEKQKPGVRYDLFIKADLHTFLVEGLKNLSKKILNNSWKNYCNSLKERFTPYEAIEGIKNDERVCMYYFWKKFSELEPEDTIIALGNNTGICAKLQIGVKTNKQRVLANNNCGSMGYDIPCALGAAVATKKEVIVVTGDGSIMMNLQELQTIVYNKLPIKVVVFENDGYNAVRQTSKNFFNGFEVGCSRESGISFPNFKEVAGTFGFKYNVVNTNKEVEEGLKWLFSEKGNLLLEIKEKLDDPVTPKMMSRMTSDGKFLSPSLEDLYPFLDEEELKKWMW
jgi:acetolactate synthase